MKYTILKGIAKTILKILLIIESAELNMLNIRKVLGLKNPRFE